MNSSSFKDAVENFGLVILDSGEVVVKHEQFNDNNRSRLAAAIREARARKIPYATITDILFNSFQESMINTMMRIDKS